MQVKPGSRWGSAVGDTEVIVVKAPATPVSLQCGGGEISRRASRVRRRPARGGPLGGHVAGQALCRRGRRDRGAVHEGGDGHPGVDGVTLARKDAKPLPASD